MSLFTNTSAFSKVGSSHAEPFSQKELLHASGRVASCLSRRVFKGRWGMNVPSLKVMPKNSASAGKSACDALVSGPRVVIVVLPPKVVITISQLLTATEVKVPGRSLWVCQTISTKDEFAGLVSNTNSMLSPVGMAVPPHQLANLRTARPRLCRLYFAVSRRRIGFQRGKQSA